MKDSDQIEREREVELQLSASWELASLLGHYKPSFIELILIFLMGLF